MATWRWWLQHSLSLISPPPPPLPLLRIPPMKVLLLNDLCMCVESGVTCVFGFDGVMSRLCVGKQIVREGRRYGRVITVTVSD